MPHEREGARRCRIPLLRELILAAFEQSVMWDEAGTVGHIVSLALLEISRAAPRPIAIPACRYPWLQCLTEALVADPAEPRSTGAFTDIPAPSALTVARLFRRQTRMSSALGGGNGGRAVGRVGLAARRETS
jgi:hypothetical protein